MTTASIIKQHGWSCFPLHPLEHKHWGSFSYWNEISACQKQTCPDQPRNHLWRAMFLISVYPWQTLSTISLPPTGRPHFTVLETCIQCLYPFLLWDGRVLISQHMDSSDNITCTKNTGDSMVVSSSVWCPPLQPLTDTMWVSWFFTVQSLELWTFSDLKKLATVEQME